MPEGVKAIGCFVFSVFIYAPAPGILACFGAPCIRMKSLKVSAGDQDEYMGDKNRMHVFDMRFMDEMVRNLFEGDVRVVLDYLSDRESLIQCRQKLRNPEEVMRMLHALSGDTRYLEFCLGDEEAGNNKKLYW